MNSAQLDLLLTDELDIALRLNHAKHAANGANGTDRSVSPHEKEARRKEKRQQKEAKVMRALKGKNNTATGAQAVKKEKLVGKAASANAEIDVNTSVEVGDLISSTDLPVQEGEGERQRFYLTTAINYTNGEPHIGHAYEAITSDVISRYHRMKGKRVFFQTGSDEHGQKIANTAAALGVEPITICDKFAGSFQTLNKRLMISNDSYLRTTSAWHKMTSQQLWQICADAGDIYLGKYEGWYDEREERYITEGDAELADFKDAYGTPLKRMSEDSYFFRLAKYLDWLVQHIKDNPSFIQPETHRQLILKRLEGGNQSDLSISRTTFQHGVPVPDGFDKRHVMYVWFDALTNYISGVHALDNDHELAPFWPASVHVIGKDITWFHCVIWPCILKSAGLALPSAVFAHGFVSAEDGRKMSKSLGNVVDPHDICNQYPVDTFRWYICRDGIYGSDLSFSKKALVLAHNSELCDTLGNLVHRSLSLMDKYNDGAVPERQDGFDFRPFEVEETRRGVDEAMDRFALQDACAVAIAAVRDTNKFLQDEEPWKRNKPEDKAFRLEIVRVCLESVYAVCHFLVPFIPAVCSRIFEKLGLAPVPISILKTDFTNIPPRTKLTVGSILFKKLELPPEDVGADTLQLIGKQSAAGSAVALDANGVVRGVKGKNQGVDGREGQPCPNQDSFTRMEIRVGKIVKAWNHEGADRLFCEEIDVGEDNPRLIASGLREHMSLEQMQGRLVLVVCNLKAARLAGFMSHGMVLAAKSSEGKVELVRPAHGSVVGERIRVEGLEGEPLTAAQVKKKKAFEDLAQDLRTDNEKVATYKGKPLLSSGGACVADTVAGGSIS